MKPTTKLMKRLSLYLFLVLFAFPAPSQADDIRDFQIEGMSIGDSLLDYFSEEEITNQGTFFYKNKKFAGNVINKHPSFKVYDAVQFVFKPEDKKYKIYDVVGVIYYDDINKCYIKKDEIIKELRELFGNTVTIEDYGTKKHRADKLGNSTINNTQFFFNSEDSIQISCTDWSEKLTKERQWFDQLKVLMANKEFVDFLNDEHYE